MEMETKMETKPYHICHINYEKEPIRGSMLACSVRGPKFNPRRVPTYDMVVFWFISFMYFLI